MPESGRFIVSQSAASAMTSVTLAFCWLGEDHAHPELPSILWPTPRLTPTVELTSAGASSLHASTAACADALPGDPSATAHSKMTLDNCA
jgi:hypothetical protein